jgi:hypothetical protein
MASRSINDVLSELYTELNESVAVLTAAHQGLFSMAEKLAAPPTDPDDPNPSLFFGTGHPEDPDTWVIATIGTNDMIRMISEGGSGHTTLTQQWIVATFASWEHHHRKQIAAFHRCAVNEIVAPVFGDLRHLRNDIVHSRARATREETLKCEVFGDWFSEGDIIDLTIGQLIYFRTLLPDAEFRAGPRRDPQSDSTHPSA